MIWWQSLLLLFGLLTLLLLVGLPAGFAFLAINLVGAVVYVLFKDKHHLREEKLAARNDNAGS